MNLLMAATPIAMELCGHPFGEAALVLEWHVLGMFVPSFFTGHLIKRFGVLPVMACGARCTWRCVLFALSGRRPDALPGALLALGVGWNFLYIGGTTLFTDTYRPDERTTAQAAMDTSVLGTMAVTSFSSGALVTTRGWSWINLGSLVPLCADRRWHWCGWRASVGARSRHGLGAPGRQRLALRCARADPATRSKRNSRHSIGPFHSGTRRDSFERICAGSFMSGLSTQAVQPAECSASSARPARAKKLRRSGAPCTWLVAPAAAQRPCHLGRRAARRTAGSASSCRQPAARRRGAAARRRP